MALANSTVQRERDKFVETATGETAVRSAEGNNALRYAVDSGDGDVFYVGTAPIGSAEDDEVWRIMKVDESSGVSITWADSDANADNKWSDRESLTYG